LTKFYIQIPTELIRNPNFSSAALYVYAKLIQRFYVFKKKYKKFEIDHRQFMFYAGIKSNKKLKDVLNELYINKLIKNKIENLPRRGMIEIELDTFFDSSSKNYYFTQLPVEILHKSILDEVGHQGIRLLFYFKSYINNWDEFCYCSYKTIESETDMSENTIIKYCNLLQKKKFIKKQKHCLEWNGEFIPDEFGNEKLNYTKYNNHYQIRYETINKYAT
jgi:Helix-turn-helix domain